MRIRNLLLLCWLAVGAVQANAQVCGGSVRTIGITAEGRRLTGSKVEWELFYALPSDKPDPDPDSTAAFVSELVGGEPRAGNFWFRTIISVPDDAAQRHIAGYDASRFSGLAERFGHPASQFSGSTTTGSIEFETNEMDNTPFLLKLSANGFRDRFVVSGFLGGCHRGSYRDGPESIELKKDK